MLVFHTGVALFPGQWSCSWQVVCLTASLDFASAAQNEKKSDEHQGAKSTQFLEHKKLQDGVSPRRCGFECVAPIAQSVRSEILAQTPRSAVQASGRANI